MEWEIVVYVFIAIVVAGMYLLIFALCKAAARGDEQNEAIWERKLEEDMFANREIKQRMDVYCNSGTVVYGDNAKVTS